MVDVYCHLAESDLEDSVRAMNGYEQKRKKETKPVCKKCNSILDLGSTLCHRCGLPQNEEGAMEKIEYEQNLMKLAKKVLEKAEKNPKIVDMLLEE